MAIDNIPINGSSAMGNQLKALNNNLFTCKAQAEQMLLQMQEMQAGSDYSQLETQYGVPTGQGTNVYAMIFALANGGGTGTGFANGAFTQYMGRIN